MLSDVWGDRLTRLEIDVTALGPIGTFVWTVEEAAVTASDNRVRCRSPGEHSCWRRSSATARCASPT